MPRPVLHPLRHRARQWVQWFGVARLLVVAVSVVVLAAGAVWVVRVPPPSTASTVPSDPPARGPTDGPHTVPVVTLVGSPVSSVPATVVVHVSGAVAEPGVHEVESGARVIVAIAAAGGALDDANLDAVNLASPLVDGQRVYVPVIGEAADPYVSSEVGGPAALPPVPVDVNRATPTELERLPGVGPAIAGAIVDERERNGPFATVDQLLRVSGIGPAKLEAIAPLVTL